MLPVFPICSFLFFFFNDTATTEIYTLSLHDALPIFLEDHAGAEKADARDDLGRDARIARATRRDIGIGHENRGPERDQGVGSQAREALAPLPLEANGGAEARGDEEIQSGLRKLHGHNELREFAAGERAANTKTR